MILQAAALTDSLGGLIPIIIAAGLIVMFAGLFVLTIVLMGPEGRFHLNRGLSGRGIDLLSYNPMTKGVESRNIRWDGQFWRAGKKGAHGIWLRLQTLTNPKDAESKQFNDAVTASTRWEGCKRAVLLASEEMCITLNMESAALITKSKEHSGILSRIKPGKGSNEQSEVDDEVGRIKEALNQAIEDEDKNEVDKLTKELFEAQAAAKARAMSPDIEDGLVALLKTMKGVGIQSLHILQPIDIADLVTFLQSASPLEMDETYESGKTAGIKLTTNPQKPGKPMNWIVLAILALVLVGGGLGIYYLISSGTLQNILPGGK